MTTVVSLAQARQEREAAVPPAWVSVDCRCIACKAEFAVLTADPKAEPFYCTECNERTAHRLFPIDATEQRVWSCDCGGDSFYVIRSTDGRGSIVCRNCGLAQAIVASLRGML